MKKLLLFFTVILIGLSVFAEGTVPQMRPAAADVPSSVNSSDNYTPGVYKQKEDLHNNQSNQSYDFDDEDDEDEDDYSENGYNPINTDASSENIKNKNFIPVQNTNTNNNNVTNSKENVKTESNQNQKAKDNKKKEKDPYKGYNDAANDPYINSLNEDTTSDTPAAAKKTYSQDDYEQAYRDMEVPTFSYIHGIDPDQYYDMKDTMWSPYPLLRLNSPLYFKTITVEPGYYLLTPREYKGDWYILFKEAGAVKYIIPTFSKDYTPEFYYKDNLPELDMTKSQRWQIKFLNAWGKYIRKSKRKPAITSNIELTDLDNNFVLIELYYGAHKYSTIFRIEKF